MTTRKRLIKLAREIPESRLIAYFKNHTPSLSDWAIKDGLLTYRQPDGQEMICMIDDEVLEFALMQYLENRSPADS